MSGDGNRFIFTGNLQTYLGPQAPSGLGYILRDRTSGLTLPVSVPPFQHPFVWVGGLSHDGSKVLMAGYIAQSNRWETAITDLQGGHWQLVSRFSDGTPSYGHVLPTQWTVNERWLASSIQTVSTPPGVWPPPQPITQCARIDLGPARSLGGHIEGMQGVPEFRLVEGLSAPGTMFAVAERLAPSTTVWLAFGQNLSPSPLSTGTLWSWPPELAASFPADASGNVVLLANVPTGLPSGYQLIGQAASADPAAPAGVALTNGLRFVAP